MQHLKTLCTNIAFSQSVKRFVHRKKDLLIGFKFCASRKRYIFMHRKKDWCIVKKICALRKRFVHREKHLCIANSDEGLKTGLGLKTIFLRSWSWPRRSWS